MLCGRHEYARESRRKQAARIVTHMRSAPTSLRTTRSQFQLRCNSADSWVYNSGAADARPERHSLVGSTIIRATPQNRAGTHYTLLAASLEHMGGVDSNSRSRASLACRCVENLASDAPHAPNKCSRESPAAVRVPFKWQWLAAMLVTSEPWALPSTAIWNESLRLNARQHVMVQRPRAQHAEI